MHLAIEDRIIRYGVDGALHGPAIVMEHGMCPDAGVKSTVSFIGKMLKFRLAEIGTPIPIVAGSSGPSTTRAYLSEIARSLPFGGFAEVAGARHFPDVKRPDAFNRLYVGWLKEHQ
jgi:pimeloyl-ACP methyl ester carboxylesterase